MKPRYLRSVISLIAVVLSTSLLLKGCGSSSSTASGPSFGSFPSDPRVQISSITANTPPAGNATFGLQILHASDLEAGVDAIEDAPNFSAVLNGLRNDSRLDSSYRQNTLTLSSGDNYIPSPFFNAASDPSLRDSYRGVAGRADISMLNAMGFQAAAFGNHEFDLGPSRVADLIRPEPRVDYPGAQFPYLSANLDFANESALRDDVTADGQEASSIVNKLAKTAVITVNGERIGLVGATTTRLGNISSPGNTSVLGGVDGTDQVDARIVQQSVDQLRSSGINKIILLAHLQQLRNEVGDVEAGNGLAEQLEGVDIIIAGGSHSVVAKDNDRLRSGDSRVAGYPILRQSRSGEPVIVVNTGSNYSYVGRLLVNFDSNGVLAGVDNTLSGAYATDAQGVSAVGGVADPTVRQIAQGIGAVIVAKDGEVFGQTTVYMNGLRSEVRTEETNLGDASADANILALRRAENPTLPVVSLKNGGGIRDSIGAIVGAGGEAMDAGERIPPVANSLSGKPEGGVSQLDIENSLRFNNSLTALTLTTEQLRIVLEHGVAGVRDGATPGSFPQVGGIAFSFNPSGTAQALNPDGSVATPGNRVRTIRLLDASGRPGEVLVRDGAVVSNIDLRVVTLNFLANAGSETPGLGGDSYPFPAFARDRVDLDQGEQDAFAAFMQDIGTFSQADTPVAQDERIQNLSARADSLA